MCTNLNAYTEKKKKNKRKSFIFLPMENNIHSLRSWQLSQVVSVHVRLLLLLDIFFFIFLAGYQCCSITFLIENSISECRIFVCARSSHPVIRTHIFILFHMCLPYGQMAEWLHKWWHRKKNRLFSIQFAWCENEKKEREIIFMY